MSHLQVKYKLLTALLLIGPDVGPFGLCWCWAVWSSCRLLLSGSHDRSDLCDPAVLSLLVWRWLALVTGKMKPASLCGGQDFAASHYHHQSCCVVDRMIGRWSWEGDERIIYKLTVNSPLPGLFVYYSVMTLTAASPMWRTARSFVRGKNRGKFHYHDFQKPHVDMLTTSCVASPTVHNPDIEFNIADGEPSSSTFS